MPEFCKDGLFDELIKGPALKRREREELMKKILESKRGDEERKYEYVMCMPERFQRYMIDKELRREYYKNKSVPHSNMKETNDGLREINNIPKKKREAGSMVNISRRLRKVNRGKCRQGVREKGASKVGKLGKGEDKGKLSKVATDDSQMPNLKCYSVPKIGHNQLDLLKKRRNELKERKENINNFKKDLNKVDKLNHVTKLTSGNFYGDKENSKNYDLIFE